MSKKQQSKAAAPGKGGIAGAPDEAMKEVLKRIGRAADAALEAQLPLGADYHVSV